MSGIFGLLGINAADSDRVYVSTLGQAVVYDAIITWTNQINTELQAAMAIFVQEMTTNFKERYKLPGSGRLQRRGLAARPGAVKAYGEWDVAYPLEDFGASLATSDVQLAYMSVADLNRHLLTIQAQNINTMRHEILLALLNNTQGTFVDPLHGSLSIEPLSNGDTVTYPPVLGTEDEATDDHYLEAGYLSAAVSDTNNPYVTIRDEIEEHFGAGTGGENIAVFINNAQRTVSEALTAFDEVPDRFVRQGDNVSVPVNLPMAPGKILGRCSGTWVIEWRWIPATYMVGVHLEAPAPLKQRVDPEDTGLGRGLRLVAESDQYPLKESFWRNRFGLGVGNRLNGVVMELGDGGTYTIPTDYD